MPMALQTAGFTLEEVDDLFSLCAGLLHLGNVRFGPEKGGTDPNDPSAVAADATTHLEAAQQLLGTGPLAGLFTTRLIKTGHGSMYSKANNTQQATTARDVCSRAIYSRVFSWIITKINNFLHIGAGGRASADEVWTTP